MNAAGDHRLLVRAPGSRARIVQSVAWALLSIGLFAGAWEFAWFIGLADPRLLPPPHVFLGDAATHARQFDTAARWRIGSDPAGGMGPAGAVVTAVGGTVGRVLAGVILAAAASLAVGMAMRYWQFIGRLTLPTIKLLASVSPVAWLPVAIFTLGVGDGSAVFMVFITMFFIMTLATISLIDAVERARIETAMMLGATRAQVLLRVILPSILPGLFVVLRLNFFAAWMVVLFAEATGVDYGLGQVIMLARNTFNPGLVFFTMTIMGLIGLLSDAALRAAQRHLIRWTGESALGRPHEH